MNFNKPRIFIFCRPYLISDFQENIAPLVDEFDFKFLTDGRKSGIMDTRKRFYSRLETAVTPEGFSPEDELDVILRCRYLRNLPPEQALKMLRSMASILQEEIDQYQPKAILAQVVDEYITYLLSEIARRRGIPYIGYFYSYFPEKSQVLLYSTGQPMNFREPSMEEIDEVYKKIAPQTFRQNYKQKDTYTPLRHLKAMLRYRIKQGVFKFLSWYEQDPLNLHYGCLPYVVERRNWVDLPTQKDFQVNWREQIQSFSVAKRPVVYFPLSYHPEATTDYWIEDKRIIDYQNAILGICQVLSKDFLVIVKEHVHMLGGRDRRFYKSLGSIPSVLSIPPLEFSNEVVDKSDLVLTGAGSTGVESFIRNKPIVSFCNRSYWFAPSQASYVDLAKIQDWPDVIRQGIASYTKHTEEAQLQFLRDCLQSTMRIRKPGKVWPLCNTEDLRLLLETASTYKSTPVNQLVAHIAS